MDGKGPNTRTSCCQRKLGRQVMLVCSVDRAHSDTPYPEVRTRGKGLLLLLSAAIDGSEYDSNAGRQVLLWMVLRDRGGLALGVLHHWLNLWPSEKARTQRLILDPLRQFLDDPGGRSPGGVRLRRIARCLIQRPQCSRVAQRDVAFKRSSSGIFTRILGLDAQAL